MSQAFSYRLRTYRPLALVLVLLGGCAFPDYTYVDPNDRDAAGDAGGSAGSAGTDGSAGETGPNQDGQAGAQEASSSDAVDEDSLAIDGAEEAAIDAPEDQQIDSPEDALPEAAEPDAGEDAEIDAPWDVSQDAPEDVSVEAQVDAPEEPPVDAGVDGPVDAPADVTDAAEEPETPAPPENCLNGVDDDWDGLADCADPDCDSDDYTCTPLPPAGWSGLFAVHEGVPSSMPAGCPTDFDTMELVAGREPVYQPASCSTCGCGDPTGTQCGEPTVQVFDQPGCVGGRWDLPRVTPHGNCNDWILNDDSGAGSMPVSVAMYAAEPVAGTGSCAPYGGQASTVSYGWTTLAAACRVNTTGGGCGSQQACIHRPSTGFNVGPCIYRQGEISSCPAPYINRSVYYTNATDTRGCTSCSCGNPVGVTCPGSLVVATSGTATQCATSGPTYETTLTGTSCSSVTLQAVRDQFFEYNDFPPTGGQCGASGGSPIGAVTTDTSSAYTICCRPF